MEDIKMRKAFAICVCLLFLVSTLGFTAVVFAKKPPKPPPPPPPEGTIYFQHSVDGDLVMSTMKGDGSEKTILGVDYCIGDQKKFGGLSRLKHGGHYWFIQFCNVEGEYPGGPQVKELFAVRDDGTMRVQLTDDPTLENDNRRWDPVFGIDDVNITFGAKRYIEGEEVPVDFGIYSAPIAYDGDGNIIGLSADPIRVWDTGYRIISGKYLVNVITFDWSPDETKIVLSKRGPDTQIVIADLGTGSESYLACGYHPRWSPDGTKIVFGQHCVAPIGLATISPDGSDEEIIVPNSIKKGPSKGVQYKYDWSPDSKHLLYTWYVDKNGPTGGYFVCVVAANGDNPTCLTDNTWKNSHTWR